MNIMYKRYYREGLDTAVPCRVCKQDELVVLGSGIIPDGTERRWYNLRCRNGHMTTVRTKDLTPSPKEEPEMVNIVRHDITMVYEKVITVFLPEDEDPEEYIDSLEEKDFDCLDSYEVVHDKHTTESSYPEHVLYDKNYKLSDRFNIMTGRVDSKPGGA